jgi:hypothetical protein
MSTECWRSVGPRSARPRCTRKPHVELGDGQIRLRVDRFAVTANNVSYAGAGDLLGYWDFFPSSDPSTWGRVPAVGYAEIVESRNADLPVGGRYHGWFPMAETVVFTATATRDGFRDDGDHRQMHAPIYRSYTRTDADPFHDDAGRRRGPPRLVARPAAHRIPRRRVLRRLRGCHRRRSGAVLRRRAGHRALRIVEDGDRVQPASGEA